MPTHPPGDARDGDNRWIQAKLLALLLAGTLLLAGCSNGDDGGMNFQSGDDDGRYGAVLEEPYQVPKTPLTDTDGASYSLADSTDRKLTLLFFGYTNCPDICQIVMSSLASAMTRLDESQRDQVDVVFVTTDPARDDEAALREYLDRFDPTFIGLTGSLRTITSIATPLGVPIDKQERLASGGYDVSHGTQVVGIDEDDEAPIVWTEGTSAAQFADDIAALLAE